MKNRVLSKIVIVGTAVLLLAAMMVSTLLGTTSAEYVKSLSQKLDIKATPDLSWRYYLGNYDPAEGKVTNVTGIYQNAENISQTLRFAGGSGDGMKYHIAFPVSEVGNYVLYFTYDMIQNQDETIDFYTTNLNNPVGCQVTHRTFAVTSSFEMASYYRIPDPSIGETYNGTKCTKANIHYVGIDYGNKNKYSSYTFKSNPSFDAYDRFQWKTVSPARAEHVSLTFVVNQSDVDKGYVLWEWDFNGIPKSWPAGKNYTEYELSLTNISYEKLDDPESGKAYFDFANTVYKNNAIIPTWQTWDLLGTGVVGPLTPTRRVGKYTNNDPDKPANQEYGEIQGHNMAGITRETGGRGTYVTEATYNSMTMQAEPVYFGYDFTANHPVVNSDEAYHPDNGYASGTYYNYSNPIAFNIPLKNVKKNTTYKVTFDLSIAKQGTKNIFNENQWKDANYPYYQTSEVTDSSFADYTSNFNDFFANSGPASMCWQSYLCGPVNKGFSVASHTSADGRNYFYYANKRYNNHCLTDFNSFTATQNSTLNTKEKAIVANYFYDVNEATKTYEGVVCNNSYNAIKHIEFNEQNEICWLTFSNTSFSFNLSGDTHGNSTYINTDKTLDYGVIDTLHWTWCIDSLQPTGWFRIKLENVRIEEVVQYGSQIEGIKIGSAETPAGARFDEYAFRGANGTGQSYISRIYAGLTQSALNLYAPIYNMDNHYVNSEERLRVYLDGYCVVEGGIDKYVWSPDNGKTWYDMVEESPPGTATADQITGAKEKVDNCVKGNATEATTSGTDHRFYADFTQNEDGRKGDFTDYRIYADLSKYAGQHDLDIIFAAVPFSNPNMRCEILKLTNYGEARIYASLVEDVISDISVQNVDTVNTLTTSTHSKEGLGISKGVKPNGFAPVSTAGVYNYYDAGREISANGTETITCKSTKIDYDRLDTLCSNIPIKTTLKLKGGIAINEVAVEKFVYSVDGGRTWKDCYQKTPTDVAVNTTETYGTLLDNWISTASVDAAYYTGKNGRFNTASTYINVDLSNYVGKTIDLIVAAKPVNYYTVCPVARIDNVAVYGDGLTDKTNDRGTFFTRVNGVYVNGGKIPDNFTAKYEDTDISLTYLDKWNMSIAPSYPSSGLTYTPFEVCNTDIFHVRKASATPLYVTNGGEIKFSGFVACPNGVNNYKYTLDGGITWTDIKDTVADFYTGDGNNTDYVTNIRRVSSDLNEDSLKNGNFMNAGGYYDTTIGWTPLTINLPNDLAQDEVIDLLVVAESNNVSSGPSGKLYPVFHQTIRVVGGDTVTQNSNIKKGTTVTLSQTVANLQSDSYVINYSAIPEFSVSKKTTSGIYEDSSMSLAKTCFNVGEDITVNYTLTGPADPKIWIAIGEPDGPWKRWEYIPKNSSDTISGSIEISDFTHEGEGYRPPKGEYEIWIIADDQAWKDKETNKIVDPIRIKIVDPNDPDFTYTSNLMQASTTPSTQTLKLYYTKPDGTAGDESIEFTNEFIHVENKVINVKPGTQVKVVAEYKNISTIKKVNCSKFTIEPNSTT